METETPVQARPLVCPLCGGGAFGSYRGRANARCTHCGAKERARFLGLVLNRLAPPPSGAPVYHFAPEPKIAEILTRRYGVAYVPADLDPDAYGWSQAPVRRVDLRRPRDTIVGLAQGFVHSHVLEHIPAPIERVVRELNALIEPGGFHLFQVPIHNGWYREDMDPDLPRDERERRFFQHDHMRLFGKQDIAERLFDLFDGFTRLDLAAHISAEDLAAGAIPVSALTSPTGHSVFLFVKGA